AKQQLFELVNAELAAPRERYNDLIQHPEKIERVLLRGAEQASAQAQQLINQLRHAVGIRALGG
ncbi:MAG: tryptophan--tRNA ligase, partial [Pseudomonadota bacterium]